MHILIQDAHIGHKRHVYHYSGHSGKAGNHEKGKRNYHNPWRAATGQSVSHREQFLGQLSYEPLLRCGQQLTVQPSGPPSGKTRAGRRKLRDNGKHPLQTSIVMNNEKTGTCRFFHLYIASSYAAITDSVHPASSLHLPVPQTPVPIRQPPHPVRNHILQK